MFYFTFDFFDINLHISFSIWEKFTFPFSASFQAIDPPLFIMNIDFDVVDFPLKNQTIWSSTKEMDAEYQIFYVIIYLRDFFFVPFAYAFCRFHWLSLKIGKPKYIFVIKTH